MSGILFFALFLLFGIPKSLPGQSYSVSYAGVPVVNVSIQSKMSGDVWFGEYHAWVKRAVSLIYSVDNTYRIKAQPGSWLPLTYTKSIHEGKAKYKLTFQYNQSEHTEKFPDGNQIAFPDSAYNLFSAMLWAQYHKWVVGEHRELLVEVDGQFWPVQIEATERGVYKYKRSDISTIKVGVTFGNPQSGQNFHGKKDILSRELPQVGRKLLLWIDTENKIIYQIQMPMQPFSIWARLR